MPEKEITKSYLDKQHACKESYAWLDKQENKDWKAIANKLYDEKKYDWCLWLLYRKTALAAASFIILISISCVLIWVSLPMAFNFATAISEATIRANIVGMGTIAVSIATIGIIIATVTAISAGMAGSMGLTAIAIVTAIIGFGVITITTGLAGAIIAILGIIAGGASDKAVTKMICRLALRR